MPEGRLTALMAGLEQRLSAARKAARAEVTSSADQPPVNAAGDPSSGSADAGTQLQCAICGSSVDDNPYFGDEGLLCSDCGVRQRDKRSSTSGGQEETAGSVETQKAGPEHGWDATSEQGHQTCDSCGDLRGETVYLGENGKLHCSACGPPEPGLSPPDLEWQEKSLSYLSREILQALHNSYPRARTPQELVEWLAGKGFPTELAKKRSVIEKLKGPLFRWTRSGGKEPAYWTLKAAPDEVGDGGGKDRSRSEEALGEDAGAGYQLCDVCRTDKPRDSILPLRGRSVCEKCFKEMRDRPG